MADPVIPGAIRVNAVLQNSNGLPEDRYINSFVFSGAGGDEAALAAIAVPFVKEFYVNDGVAGGLSSWLGPQCSRAANASSLVWYDLSEAPVRTPHAETFTLNAPAAGPESVIPLPAEVACVLSLQTPVNSPSGRGRLYLGPFNQAAAEPAADGDSAPAAGLITTITFYAAQLADHAVAAGAAWCVLSRKFGNLSEITGGYVDNAWDTQRRRGRTPTARTGWIRGA